MRLRVRKGRTLAGRIVLTVVTFWALLMVVPDFHRIIQPLASAGFAADNDGSIYNVKGPSCRRIRRRGGPTAIKQQAGPARDGMQPVGNRNTAICSRCWAAGRRATCQADACSGYTSSGPTEGASALWTWRRSYPTTWLERGVLLFVEFIATLFILAAAWLVWTRRGMAWGFFLYCRLVELRPKLCLLRLPAGTAAFVAGAGSGGRGDAGPWLRRPSCCFVLRVPSNQTFPAWRGWKFVLPLVAFFFVGLQLLSYTSAFGRPSETASRITFLAGFAVDSAAILILLRRRRGLPPPDYNRCAGCCGVV